MRITWASNAPWAPTGYGTQTKQMLKRLIADGHEVAVAANWGLGARLMQDPDSGALVLPMGADLYSNDVIRAHDNFWTKGEPSWIITLYDAWVYKLEHFADARVASWAPVDHYPVPPKVAEWCRLHPTIAMSRFGEKALKEAGVAPMYAPHGIELDVMKPTPTLPDGSDVRKVLNIPDDAFLVMIAAANKGRMPPRKSWGEMLAAMALFMQDHKDVYLYLHTDVQGVNDGVDLIVLQAALGIDANRVRVPDQYANLTGLVTPEVLAAHYTTADVLLASSMGEGFGIPVVEAQACGTPVIVTNFSAQPELVGAGWIVSYQPWWDPGQASWLALPIMNSIEKALNAAYERRGEQQLHDDAIAKAAEYDADKVFAEHWRPILATLEEQLKPKVRKPYKKNRKRAA